MVLELVFQMVLILLRCLLSLLRIENTLSTAAEEGCTNNIFLATLLTIWVGTI